MVHSAGRASAKQGNGQRLHGMQNVQTSGIL